jgi:hypothetical protein
MFTFMPSPSPLSQQTMADQYQTGVGEALQSGVSAGLEDTSWGIALRIANWFDARGSGDAISETAWKNSDSYRKGLTWRPDMTSDLAEVLALRHDEEQNRAFLWSKSGVAAKAATIAGGFLGAIPDPVNFLPILSIGGAAGKMVEALGPRLGNIAVHATEAAAGAALYQPAMAYTAHLEQDDFDLRMAVVNVMMAAGIGAGFGAIHAALAGRTPEERLRATGKAVSDLIQERPVDVSPVMVPQRTITDEVRAYLNSIPDGQVGKQLDAVQTPGFLRTAEQRLDVRDMSALDLQSTQAHLADVEQVLAALRKPAFARSAEEMLTVKDAYLAPDGERAFAIALKDPAVRSAKETQFLSAFQQDRVKEHFVEARQQTVAQAQELDNQLATVNTRIAATEASLQAVAPTDIATRDALTATRDNLLVEAKRIEGDASELVGGKPLDFAVGERPPAPPEPRVTATTPENLREPVGTGEVDFTAQDARFKELEANGLLPTEAHDAIAAAAKEMERMDAQGRAIELAALCLTRPG